MQFVVTAFDKENSLDLRMGTREAHLAYLNEVGVVLIAGPLLTEDETPKPRGSVLIIEVADRAAAEAFAANDPYAKAGLFDKVTIRRWLGAVGSWLPSSD